MVNQSNIFKKIGYILNELQDQYEFLSENPDQLSELELELFLANANFLSDHVQIVKKLNSNQPLKELPPPVEQKIAAKPVEEVFAMPSATVPTPVEVFPTPVEPVPIHVEAVKPFQIAFSEETHSLAEETPAVVEEVPEITEQANEEAKEANMERVRPSSVNDDIFKFDDTPATFEFIIEANKFKAPVELEEVLADNHHEGVVDYFKDNEQEADKLDDIDINTAEEIVSPTAVPKGIIEDEVGPEPFLVSPATPKPTINELLAGHKTANINEDNSSPVITDLKKAVNLNEKLLYIKDLFNGYNLAYSEAIDILNKLPDFKAADAFLKNNYAVKNNWDAKQVTVEKFYDLLKQRFPGD
ncbi:hypothetical protein ACVWYN_002567 [Pedobacter sp. UYP24]